MRIYLINDTSGGNAHVGMQAVMRSIHTKLAHHRIIKVSHVGDQPMVIPDNAEAVVCNGEGSIHHDSLWGRQLLQTLDSAQRSGLKTYLVNAVFQQEPGYFKEVLSRLDYMSVREPMSQSCARECGGDPELLADSSADPDWYEIEGAQNSERRPFVGLWPYWPTLRDEVGGRTMTLREGTWNETVNRLHREASVYITGQHHGIYAAAMAGVPFVPIPSNSWKIPGLLWWFKKETGEEIPIIKANIRVGMEFAKANPGVFMAFSVWLKSKAVWGGINQNQGVFK